MTDMLYGESELPYFAKERLRIGQVLNLFGGVEVSVTLKSTVYILT